MRIVLFVVSLCLCLALAASAATVSVPLNVTPPAPAAFTAQISQSATVNGVTYTVTGTLTFTPASTGALLPGGPALSGYKDANHQRLVAARPGDSIYLEGWGWGDTPGTVTADLVTPMSVSEWMDGEIGVTLPPDPFSLLCVIRPDRAYYLTRGPESAN